MNEPAYFVDRFGHLWKGPIQVDNFRYLRYDGICFCDDGTSRAIWIAKRSDPDPTWILLPSDPTQDIVT